MFRKFRFFAIVLVALAAAPRGGQALELGLTPSNVFSLWTNINDALLAVARISSDNANWAKKVEASAPRAFAGKTPANVLERVAEFREKLDRLRRRDGMAKTARFENGDGVVSPSVVFLNSGHVLDGVALWIVNKTTKEQLVSPFFRRHDVSGKTPSDVFGLVDLANRRIDTILENSSAG